MAEQASGAAVTAGENELVSSRIIDAPREAVFDAWTDPELLAQWWGPKGFTNTFSEFDPRPGGTWEFVMHGPNGVDYANTNVFSEVVRPERIVLKHVLAPVFVLTATFEEADGGTLIVFRQHFEEAAVYEQVKGYAAGANEENLDKLSALVTGLTS